MQPVKSTVALTETMPSYQTTLIAPAGTYPWQILIRFYAPWGDGSPEGWQIPLTPPTVLVNGVAYPVDVVFSYNQSYMEGQPSPGYDQHEQCFGVFIGQIRALEEEMLITISGEFQQVGYMSVTLYFNLLATPTLPIEVIDSEMTAVPDSANPYIPGNPSVFANANSASGKINFYRPDKVDSLSILPDEVAEDGCSKGYLLGDPSGSLIVRYRDPADNWVGNPANAVCYLDKASNQPVTTAELGEYLPELYGDTLANFLAGHIGDVIKDQAWPD
ncbi:hypothetical protein [Pseudescherichia vulneris]|uniref:hypothetical protein n=1 Tax=Pseudescherichia vulneris TaxID=566 RepID=UPI003019D0A6